MLRRIPCVPPEILPPTTPVILSRMAPAAVTRAHLGTARISLTTALWFSSLSAAATWGLHSRLGHGYDAACESPMIFSLNILPSLNASDGYNNDESSDGGFTIEASSLCISLLQSNSSHIENPSRKRSSPENDGERGRTVTNNTSTTSLFRWPFAFRDQRQYVTQGGIVRDCLLWHDAKPQNGQSFGWIWCGIWENCLPRLLKRAPIP